MDGAPPSIDEMPIRPARASPRDSPGGQGGVDAQGEEDVQNSPPLQDRVRSAQWRERLEALREVAAMDPPDIAPYLVHMLPDCLRDGNVPCLNVALEIVQKANGELISGSAGLLDSTIAALVSSDLCHSKISVRDTAQSILLAIGAQKGRAVAVRLADAAEGRSSMLVRAAISALGRLAAVMPRAELDTEAKLFSAAMAAGLTHKESEIRHVAQEAALGLLTGGYAFETSLRAGLQAQLPPAVMQSLEAAERALISGEPQAGGSAADTVSGHTPGSLSATNAMGATLATPAPAAASSMGVTMGQAVRNAPRTPFVGKTQAPRRSGSVRAAVVPETRQDARVAGRDEPSDAPDLAGNAAAASAADHAAKAGYAPRLPQDFHKALLSSSSPWGERKALYEQIIAEFSHSPIRFSSMPSSVWANLLQALRHGAEHEANHVVAQLAIRTAGLVYTNTPGAPLASARPLAAALLGRLKDKRAGIVPVCRETLVRFLVAGMGLADLLPDLLALSKSRVPEHRLELARFLDLACDVSYTDVCSTPEERGRLHASCVLPPPAFLNLGKALRAQLQDQIEAVREASVAALANLVLLHTGSSAHSSAISELVLAPLQLPAVTAGPESAARVSEVFVQAGASALAGASGRLAKVASQVSYNLEHGYSGLLEDRVVALYSQMAEGLGAGRRRPAGPVGSAGPSASAGPAGSVSSTPGVVRRTPVRPDRVASGQQAGASAGVEAVASPGAQKSLTSPQPQGLYLGSCVTPQHAAPALDEADLQGGETRRRRPGKEVLFFRKVPDIVGNASLRALLLAESRLPSIFINATNEALMDPSTAPQWISSVDHLTDAMRALQELLEPSDSSRIVFDPLVIKDLSSAFRTRFLGKLDDEAAFLVFAAMQLYFMGCLVYPYSDLVGGSPQAGESVVGLEAESSASDTLRTPQRSLAGVVQAVPPVSSAQASQFAHPAQLAQLRLDVLDAVVGAVTACLGICFGEAILVPYPLLQPLVQVLSRYALLQPGLTDVRPLLTLFSTLTAHSAAKKPLLDDVYSHLLLLSPEAAGWLNFSAAGALLHAVLDALRAHRVSIAGYLSEVQDSEYDWYITSLAGLCGFAGSAGRAGEEYPAAAGELSGAPGALLHRALYDLILVLGRDIPITVLLGRYKAVIPSPVRRALLNLMARDFSEVSSDGAPAGEADLALPASAAELFVPPDREKTMRIVTMLSASPPYAELLEEPAAPGAPGAPGASGAQPRATGMDGKSVPASRAVSSAHAGEAAGSQPPPTMEQVTTAFKLLINHARENAAWIDTPYSGLLVQLATRIVRAHRERFLVERSLASVEAVEEGGSGAEVAGPKMVYRLIRYATLLLLECVEISRVRDYIGSREIAGILAEVAYFTVRDGVPCEFVAPSAEAGAQSCADAADLYAGILEALQSRANKDAYVQAAASMMEEAYRSLMTSAFSADGRRAGPTLDAARGRDAETSVLPACLAQPPLSSAYLPFLLSQLLLPIMSVFSEISENAGLDAVSLVRSLAVELDSMCCCLFSAVEEACRLSGRQPLPPLIREGRYGPAQAEDGLRLSSLITGAFSAEQDDPYARAIAEVYAEVGVFHGVDPQLLHQPLLYAHNLLQLLLMTLSGRQQNLISNCSLPYYSSLLAASLGDRPGPENFSSQPDAREARELRGETLRDAPREALDAMDARESRVGRSPPTRPSKIPSSIPGPSSGRVSGGERTAGGAGAGVASPGISSYVTDTSKQALVRAIGEISKGGPEGIANLHAISMAKSCIRAAAEVEGEYQEFLDDVFIPELAMEVKLSDSTCPLIRDMLLKEHADWREENRLPSLGKSRVVMRPRAGPSQGGRSGSAEGSSQPSSGAAASRSARRQTEAARSGAAAQGTLGSASQKGRSPGSRRKTGFEETRKILGDLADLESQLGMR